MVFVVSIESPLGGGKGFFLKYVRQHALIKGLETQVVLQDDSISHVMDMNNDPRRWLCFTEFDFMYKHVLSVRDARARKPDILVIEGSPATDRGCYFLDMQCEPCERELYEEWYGILGHLWSVDLHVHLKSSIHSHFERVMGNSKKEQAFVTLTYLAHKLRLFQDVLPGCPRLVCENNFEDNEPVLEVMRQKLCALISHRLKGSPGGARCVPGQQLQHRSPHPVRPATAAAEARPSAWRTPPKG